MQVQFTHLFHIKKLQTVAPTISEVKEKLAKFKYHIQLDLSNYFYQGGMRIEDCQYLATPHPFRGLRVYVCEPQGLKNASEHAYERLGLVYGDLCEQEKLTIFVVKEHNSKHISHSCTAQGS